MCVSPAISQVYIGKAEIKNGVMRQMIGLFHRASVLVKIDGHM